MENTYEQPEIVEAGPAHELIQDDLLLAPEKCSEVVTESPTSTKPAYSFGCVPVFS